MRQAADELLAAAPPRGRRGDASWSPRSCKANRELIAGIHRDPQFGPTVMLGIGGVLTEALADVAFRLAPFERVDAADMLDQLRTQALLGEVRGEPAVDRTAHGGRAARPVRRWRSSGTTSRSADLNPLLVVDGTRSPSTPSSRSR